LFLSPRVLLFLFFPAQLKASSYGSSKISLASHTKSGVKDYLFLSTPSPPPMLFSCGHLYFGLDWHVSFEYLSRFSSSLRTYFSAGISFSSSLPLETNFLGPRLSILPFTTLFLFFFVHLGFPSLSSLVPATAARRRWYEQDIVFSPPALFYLSIAPRDYAIDVGPGNYLPLRPFESPPRR